MFFFFGVEVANSSPGWKKSYFSLVAISTQPQLVRSFPHAPEPILYVEFDGGCWA
jgi:hypothetical protein